jgi:type F conjugative transfer system protein TrbI
VSRKRLVAAGAGLGLLVIVAAVLSREPSASAPTAALKSGESFDVGIPTAQEVRNMLGVYGERVESTERDVAALRVQLHETQKKLEEAGQKNASALDRLLQELQGAAKQEPPALPPASRFRTFEFEKRRSRSMHVPAGSFGEARLLTGVFAPVTGEPLPVLLRLEAALVGPQRSRVPIRGAFLIGKAQGDANSRRATVQLDTLSVMRPDGTPFETKVNGWAADEDGIQGLRGNYVWRADEVLALSSLTGALSGGSDAMAQRETTTQMTPLGGAQGAVTGDPLKFAGYRSLSSAFGRLSDMVSQRLNEVVPAIYVPNGRTITVAFIGGVTLEGMEAPEGAASPFSGLDR